MKLKDVTINYQLLAEAIAFYKERGYEMVELPWMVNKAYSMLTCPSEDNAFAIEERFYTKHLVGSAEQAFLHQSYFNDQLKPFTKYMAVTPCFRRGEDDETHSEQFIKLELFESTEAPCHHSIEYAQAQYYDSHALDELKMIRDAGDLFLKLGIRGFLAAPVEDNGYFVETKKPDYAMSVSTIRSYDIWGQDKDGKLIEVGSYGLRRQDIPKLHLTIRRWYTYGTGIALPRFQLVL